MTVLDHKANPRRDMREAIVGVQVGKRALFGKCLAPNVVSLLLISVPRYARTFNSSLGSRSTR